MGISYTEQDNSFRKEPDPNTIDEGQLKFRDFTPAAIQEARKKQKAALEEANI